MKVDLEFANAWVLYLVWLAPALGVWWYAADRRRRRAALAFVSHTMRRKIAPAERFARFRWQAGLILTGLLLCLFAAARPQWGTQEQTVVARGRDVVIALDVSRSMLAADVYPNRLQRAKADVMDLIRELSGDRAALLAFRRKGVLLCPLTTDYAYLTQALDGLGVDSAPRGETDIGDAIVKAMDAFESDEGAHKAIILISDGEDLTGRGRQCAEEAGKKNIAVFTVGMGSRKGATIPGQGEGAAAVTHGGAAVVSKLDSDALYAIATASGGRYIDVETASMASTTLGTLYRDHIRKIGARELQETQQRRRVERFQWFLLPGVLALIAGGCLSRGRLRVGGRKSAVGGQRPERGGGGGATPRARAAGTAAGVVAGLLAAAARPADGATNAAVEAATNASAPALTVTNVPPGRDGARMAQRLYLAGEYAAAAGAYQQAARGSGGEDARDFRYNAAAALYRAGNYRAAADILGEIAGQESARRPDALAGLGSALFAAAAAEKKEDAAALAEKARLVKGAGDAFRAAVRARPRDDVSRRNLAALARSWGEAEDKAKIAGLMARYAQTPPGQLAWQMLRDQRAINAEAERAFTNAVPDRIRQLESLGDRQSANADLWIPLKGKLMQAMAAQPNDPTNRQIMATLNQTIEATRENMLGAAGQFGDLDPAGAQSAAVTQAGIYNMWKAIAAYPEILQEDMWWQTNAIALTAREFPDEEQESRLAGALQQESGELTRLFAERFAQAVPAGGTPLSTNAPALEPGGTNGPSQAISAETRQKILELARQAGAAQDSALALLKQCNAAGALPEERRAYDLLQEIAKLLPKNQSRQQQPQQEKNEEQQQQPSPAQSANEQPPPQPESQSPPPPEPSEQAPEPPPPATPEEVRRVLARALQREKEHEQEVRERSRNIPSSPVDRDW